MSEQPKIFTLRQVVSSIRKTIEERYQSMYWVKAEMHKLNQYPSGHCFPELLEKADGKIVAQMSGTIWKHHFDLINERFMSVVKEPLKDDLTLLMKVKVEFHETYGLKLQILDIDPNYTLGELQRERQETLKKLQAAGLINANQQLRFPLLPRRVAVISAESSKGLSDFNKVLDENPDRFSVFRMLFPAYVQGDLAIGSIIRQLKRIEKVRHHFDVVVIVRGGGGEVGMSCYNHYGLCEAIASFPLPVLTGIGHSTNLTVAEMIAHRNAITPTELADFLLDAFREFAVPVYDAPIQLTRGIQRLLRDNQQRIGSLAQRFRGATQSGLHNHQLRLNRSGEQIRLAFQHGMHIHLQTMSNVERSLAYRATRVLSEIDVQQQTIVSDLRRSLTLQLQQRKSQLEESEHLVRIMDPIHVLKRGYSITTLNGKSIGSNVEPAEGDTLSTRTATFNVESTVTRIKRTEND